MASFSLGCHDIHGNPLAQNIPVGQERNRRFVPANDPRFNNSLITPNNLIVYSAIDQVSYLRYGDLYTLTSDDQDQVKKIVEKSETAGCVKGALENKIMFNAIVIEVAAGLREGKSVACRYFGGYGGKDSEYNRGGIPREESEVRALFCTVDIGAQAARTIVTKHKHIDTVIFMTSSQELIDGATNIWQWTQSGFPSTLPAGLTTEDYYMLHNNLKNLEAVGNGVQVQFWKVDKAFILGAAFDVMCRLDDYQNLPNEATMQRFGGKCVCRNCMVGIQHAELHFAKTGPDAVKKCPCPTHNGIAAKYANLKKGDTFTLTNIVGSDFKVTMEVNGSS